jgi:hypothetical protein
MCDPDAARTGQVYDFEMNHQDTKTQRNAARGVGRSALPEIGAGPETGAPIRSTDLTRSSVLRIADASADRLAASAFARKLRRDKSAPHGCIEDEDVPKSEGRRQNAEKE